MSKYPSVTVGSVTRLRDTGTVATGLPYSVIIGRLNRGPTSPTVVSSWNEFQRVYGDYSVNSQTGSLSTVVDGAFLFFSNSAPAENRLLVVRVPGQGAKKSSASLGTGSSAVTAEAVSPGLWGDAHAVKIVGDKTNFSVSVGFSNEDGTDIIGTPVEQFVNLTLDNTQPKSVTQIVTPGSEIINILVPAGVDSDLVAGTYSLSGGDDGTWPSDRSQAGIPSEAALKDALDLLEPFTGNLTVAVPGVVNSTLCSEVDAWCAERGDCFAVLDFVESATSVPALPLNAGKGFSASYAPKVEVVDPLSNSLVGTRRAMYPSGAVLGAYATNDSFYGPWKTPAGTTARIAAVQAQTKFTDAQLGLLHDSRVNVIRNVSGIGLCIMGGRVANSDDSVLRNVAVRRSLSYVATRAKALTEFALFQPNGPELWESIRVRLINFLGLYYQSGALRGTREPEAFYVKCDESNNTPSTIARGEVHVEIGLAVEFPAEFITINLTQFQTDVIA